ncbi:MAG: hypothetical protein DI533_21740 [Cereibacter sphaeroides]|uniref:Uncharacterized protein n=1 Tax=Cereibacter sphaeroides TaxID=1063 RepID=A0A2W5TG98_CERSP|nr:MAG: hypothetical protein DI533_21740 [Cereibacter sphaeroides]
MLVAQARENNVVSFGGEAEDFGVADIGVILEMLSTTLYTDKPRAVSREVLCNAFDAHFAAGREDIPVDVVIDDKQIEFRDYGLGIARDQIGPVYCTFAASTKANDETQTGGHGVGAKSPFSVTDQFTVISRHAGTLSTFSLFTTDRVPQHRYVGGRPCEDEGISVIIPLKNANLGASMRHHILRVAEDAGMKIRINDELFDFTSARLFENDDIRISTRKGHRDAVDILYGRVIYPFQHDVDPELDALHREVAKIAEKLRGRQSSVTISVKAPPSSLATALSRESLSYTDRSIKNLIAQFRQALAGLKAAGASASALFFAANKLSTWGQLVAIRNDRNGFSLPVTDNACVEMFLNNEREAWSTLVRDERGLLAFAKATKSQIAWRQVKAFAKNPRLFHVRKLAKVLGPFARELRAVKPADGAYEVTRYAFLAGGPVAESRRLTADSVNTMLTRTTVVTIAPSLAAIERERRREGIFLIVGKKDRAQVEVALAGISKLGYSLEAISEREIIRTQRERREPRKAPEARSWPALTTNRNSYGARNNECAYSVTSRQMQPAAFMPLSFTGEGATLPTGFGKIRIERCLQAIAGGPIAYIRQVGQLKDAYKADIPEISTVIEASLDEMQKRIGADAFFLATRISRVAVGTAYHDLWRHVDLEKTLISAAAYFPELIAARLFPSAHAAPTSSDVLKLITARMVITLFKDNKSRLDKVMSSSADKVQEIISAKAQEQAATLQRVATIFREAKPDTAELYAEAEALEHRVEKTDRPLAVAFQMLDLNAFIEDSLNAALAVFPEDISPEVRVRLETVEAALRRILFIQDTSHAA